MCRAISLFISDDHSPPGQGCSRIPWAVLLDMLPSPLPAEATSTQVGVVPGRASTESKELMCQDSNFCISGF